MDDKLLADLMRKHGNKLVEKAVDKLTTSGVQPVKRRASVVDKIAGAALLRIASRSVPGAILVGGGLLAKHFHDRRRAARAANAANAASPATNTATTTATNPGK